MEFFTWAVQPLKKYADFSGRASRAEFWYFFLFVALVQAAGRILDTIFGGRSSMPGPFSALLVLLLIVPQVAVAVRRLHDVNRSGRELIVPGVMLLAMPIALAFRTLLGGIVALGYYGLLLLMFGRILSLLIKKGSTIPNRYGACPTAFSFGA